MIVEHSFVPHLNVISADELKELICTDLSIDPQNFDLSCVAKYDDKSKLYYRPIGKYPPCRCLLTYHYIAEQIFQHEYDEINWEFATYGYTPQPIVDLIRLWSHPLVWIDRSYLPQDIYVPEGKIAKEEYDEERLYTNGKIDSWVRKFKNEMILYFADHMPSYALDSEAHEGYYALKGMYKWDMIAKTIDVREIAKSNKGYMDSPFDANTFRANINSISRSRGKKKASEIVQAFQQDWPQIVNWNCFHVGKLNETQLAAFEKCLFEGFERELCIPNPRKQKEISPIFIERADKVATGDIVNTKIVNNKKTE